MECILYWQSDNNQSFSSILSFNWSDVQIDAWLENQFILTAAETDNTIIGFEMIQTAFYPYLLAMFLN